MIPTLFHATLALTLCGAPPAPQTAKDLNAEGFRVYKQGKFPEALELFGRSMAADDGLALAHYNYAATLGVLRAKEGACSHGAYRSEIVRHLTRAVELDEGRRVRMKADRDFDPIRDTVGYLALLGRSPKNPKDVAAIVEQVTWYGAAPGAFGPRSGADFKPGGKVELWFQTMSEDDGAPRKEKVLGSWSTAGARVKVKLARPLGGKSVLEGTLDAQGALTLPEPFGRLTDDPSECDA
jgi:hypothetical protein